MAASVKNPRMPAAAHSSRLASLTLAVNAMIAGASPHSAWSIKMQRITSMPPMRGKFKSINTASNVC